MTASSAASGPSPVFREKPTSHLSNTQRQGILQHLLQFRKGNRLERGAIKNAAARRNVAPLTTSKIWGRAISQFEDGAEWADVSSLKAGRCGRKRKDHSQQLSTFRSIPCNIRSTVRSAAASVKISKSTFFEILQRGEDVKRISSTVKPMLTEKRKAARLKFCLSKISSSGLLHDFQDHIHIDEKWFNITKVKRSCYLAIDEDPPERSCKSKRFITKIMFLAAVAKPRWDPHKKKHFDGKIGIWPFARSDVAKRSSKNRKKGAPATIPISSVDKAASKKWLIEKAIPAARSKFPASRKSRPARIQQDNAKPRAAPNDSDVAREGKKEGRGMRLANQPPASPDFNALDLGFFNSIQSLQRESSPKNAEELILVVEKAFRNLEPEKLDKVFVSLQGCLREPMRIGGKNDCKTSHFKKGKAIKENLGPAAIRRSEVEIEEAKVKLEEMEAKQEMLAERKRLLQKQQRSPKKSSRLSVSGQQSSGKQWAVEQTADHATA